jgi:hypothetical protein
MREGERENGRETGLLTFLVTEKEHSPEQILDI